MKRSFAVCVLLVSALLYLPEGHAMRGMHFLEKFDLSELSYTGANVRSGACRGETWATVLDPEHLPHHVRRGDYIGKNYGLVTRITFRYIQVRELHQDSRGEWVEKVIRLPITSNMAPRARYRYEQDHALSSLGQAGASGRLLQERLLECRQLYGKDAERLACFDAAVGTLI